MADNDARIDLGIRGLGPAEHIGRGGFADVYRAEQLSLRRTVAVKVLRAQASDVEAEARFERECHAIGAVADHPHIVGVHEGGFTSNGRAYLVMEYLPGGPLSERLDEQGPLSGEEAVDIGIKIGRALAEAHRVGILHRDLKPANIMISAYGEPALGDFGIARIEGGHRTATGLVTASFAHAAPEVLEGHPPSISADVYSLGSTLYELLVGQAPYFDPSDDTVWPLMKRILSEPMPSPESAGMGTLLGYAFRRATARDPADRYQTAEEFVRDLEAAKSTPPLLVAAPVRPPAEPSAGADGSDGAAAASADLAKADLNQTKRAGPLTLDTPPAAATPDLLLPAADAPTPTGEMQQPWSELYKPPVSPAEPAMVGSSLPLGNHPLDKAPSGNAPVGNAPPGNTPFGNAPPGIVPPGNSPSSGSKGFVLGAVVAVLGGLGLLVVGGFWLFSFLDSDSASSATAVVVGAETGPLMAGAELEITVSGAPDGATFRPVIDGLATGTSEPELSPVTLEAGRHSVAVEINAEGDLELTEPVEVYATGEPPGPGYRANLASVAVEADGWQAALVTFDRLVADGHDDVQILRSDDSPQQTPGYWNMFVAGFGDDPAAAETYCKDYGLLIPDQCFAGYFDPNA